MDYVIPNQVTETEAWKALLAPGGAVDRAANCPTWTQRFIAAWSAGDWGWHIAEDGDGQVQFCLEVGLKLSTAQACAAFLNAEVERRASVSKATNVR